MITRLVASIVYAWLANASVAPSFAQSIGTPIPNGTQATTQSSSDNTNAVATDAFVQTAVSGETTRFAAAGVTTGSANAQVISTVSPPVFSFTGNPTVSFIAGFSNTGATTLNVTGTGVKNVLKKTAAGLVALATGDVIANQQYLATYDGTQYELQEPSTMAFTDTKNTFTSDQFFSSGRPWADVKAFGAVGNGVADDTTAIANAITAAASTSGANSAVYFPPGHYCVFSGVTVTATGLQLIAASNNVVLDACGHDVTPLTINASYVQVTDLGVLGDNATGTTHPAMAIGSSCTGCFVTFTQIVWGTGVTLTGADVVMWNSYITSSYGSALLKITNASAPHLHRMKMDQNYPGSSPAQGTSFAAWQSAHAYTAGAIVSTGGFYIEAANSGTSAGGAPTVQPYGTYTQDNITGSCPSPSAGVCWQLVAPTTYYALQLDTGTSAVLCEDCDFSGSFTAGLALTNTLSGTGPQDTVITDSVFGQNWQASIYAHDGEGLAINGSTIASCIFAGCEGIWFTGSWFDHSSIVGNLFIANVNGIEIDAGTNAAVVGNRIFGSTGSAIKLGAAVTNGSITANQLGVSAAWGTNTVGITLGTFASDYWVIADNQLNGATTPITNTSTGTHNRIVDNPGYNPVGATAAANVCASPCTITAGPAPETHYLKQTATNTATVTVGGQQVATLAGSSTYYSVQLGPNESMIVTWSTTTPTDTKYVH